MKVKLFCLLQNLGQILSYYVRENSRPSPPWLNSTSKLLMVNVKVSRLSTGHNHESPSIFFFFNAIKFLIMQRSGGLCNRRAFNYFLYRQQRLLFCIFIPSFFLGSFLTSLNKIFSALQSAFRDHKSIIGNKHKRTQEKGLSRYRLSNLLSFLISMLLVS